MTSESRPGRTLLPLAFIAGALLVALVAYQAGLFGGRSREADPNDWLLNIETENERLAAVQKHLRGFDVTMWETGERFERLHDAVQRQNYPMAVYQWDKIGQTIVNGTERRPRWAEPANAMFFGTYAEVRAGLQSGDPAKAREAFELAKTSCMGCHQGVGADHMNDQRLFDLALNAEPR